MINRRLILLLVISCGILSVYYKCYDYYTWYRPIHIEINTYNGAEDYLINTTGCVIPNYINTFNLKESENLHMTCSERAVFVKKLNDTLSFKIDKNVFNRVYNTNNDRYQCCYSVVSRSNVSGSGDTVISYSQCRNFRDNHKIPHENEVYLVVCVNQTPKGIWKEVIYEDAYLILKKQKTRSQGDNRWNLLVIGIDTISRARLIKSMPKTAEYLQRHGWLDFRGLQKVGYNTLPNLGALLMGQNISTIHKECDNGMDPCKHHMIWTRFHEAGYKTAYGEDNIHLPDTFASLKGFKDIPTDHYTRPFYLIGESQQGNIVCTKSLPSAEHMLNYAYDFVNVYKSNGFFGCFWLNSISHNSYYLPALHDENMVKFFEKINSTGALRNTFILFLSDHGIRIGKSRQSIESYYDERLPMLYIWTPLSFRKQYPLEYNNLQVNQNRLITHYDLHLTFHNILELTYKSSTSDTKLPCKSCMSILKKIPENRVCADVGVNEMWCTCRVLLPIQENNIGATISVQLAASYLNNKALETETQSCKKCAHIELDKVLRTHTYKEGDKNIYVVAFKMKPIDSDYEATVKEENGNYEIVENIYTLTPYKENSHCAMRTNDRAHCFCETDYSRC